MLAVMVAVAAAAWAGSASAAQAHQPVPASSLAVRGVLTGVAATSASNAWAVGSTGRDGKLLILHWNGKRWT
jgi:hypothetical protein